MRFLSKASFAPTIERNRNKRSICFILCAAITAVFPLFVFAQVTINYQIPGAQAVSTNNPCTTVINFYQFALLISGILAFGAIVYGGIRYALAAGNPSGQTEGKEWITGALWGILLLAGAYLILNVINPALTKCEMPQLSPLPQTVAPSSFNGGNGGQFGGGGASGGWTPNGAATGPVPAGISAAAAAYQGANTSAGPGNGRVACAWAVNNVLTNAGMAPLDSNSVASMESALTSGRGTLVDQSSAVPGDIVVQAQDGHVGICMNNGCTQVVSNSSSKGSFSWISDTNFSPSYSGGPSRIYQVNK
jgi:hypothetical protein